MKPFHLIRNTFLTGVCIGLLTGCSWIGDWPPGGDKKEEKTALSAPQPPESKIAANDAGKWPQPKGVVTDSDAAARIAELEQTVAQLRSDISAMMPALTRLAQAQTDVQKEIAAIEPASGAAMGMDDPSAQAPLPITQPSASGGPQPGTVAWYEEQERLKRQESAPMAPQQQTQPAAAPQMQAQPAQPAPAQYQPASYDTGSQAAPQGMAVTNVRFGEHPDKTRLVLDTSDMAAFTYTIDNSEQILTVSLPHAAWNGPARMDVGNSPLVSSYSVAQDTEGGQQLIIQLKHPARVLWAQALMPGGAQGHRIVFDIAPL